MNYYIRKPESNDFRGPFSLAEIRQEVVAQRATLQWEAIEATGQSYRGLVKAAGWVPLHPLVGDCHPTDGGPVASAPTPPLKKSMLARCALWSGVATVGIPALWALLGSTLGGNASLAVAWYGVLPVLLFVPVGILVTLGLTIAAVCEANNRKRDAMSDKAIKHDQQ